MARPFAYMQTSVRDLSKDLAPETSGTRGHGARREVQADHRRRRHALADWDKSGLAQYAAKRTDYLRLIAALESGGAACSCILSPPSWLAADRLMNVPAGDAARPHEHLGDFGDRLPVAGDEAGGSCFFLTFNRGPGGLRELKQQEFADLGHIGECSNGVSAGHLARLGDRAGVETRDLAQTAFVGVQTLPEESWLGHEALPRSAARRVQVVADDRVENAEPQHNAHDRVPSLVVSSGSALEWRHPTQRPRSEQACPLCLRARSH